MSPGSYISSTYGNFTFHVHFQDKNDISCGIVNFTCLVQFQDKDIWYFVYISYGINILMCLAHFPDQGHVTFTVHFLYMSHNIRNFIFDVHFHKKDTLHFLYILCGIRKFVSCTSHLHDQGHVASTIATFPYYITQTYNELLHFKK